MKNKNKIIQIIYWPPRILAILFTIFISLFALDVFSEDYDLLESIAALFIHLIPTFVLAATTFIAWKWEMIGGTIFSSLGILFTFFFAGDINFAGFLLVPAPIILIGFLFILSNRFEDKFLK